MSRSPVHHALTRLVSGGPALRQGAPRLLRDAGHRACAREGYDVRARTRAARRGANGRLGSSATQLGTVPGADGGAQAAISQQEWDTANAAFHEYQIDLAGNAMLSRFYRELSVNLMMQVIRGGRLEGGEYLAPSTRAIVEAFEAGDLDAARDAIRTHIDSRSAHRARRDRARRRRALNSARRRAGLLAALDRDTLRAPLHRTIAGVAITPDRRVLESGIEVKPVYGAADAPSGSSSRRARFRSRGGRIRTCTAGARGRSASTRGSARPRRRTRATATCSRAGPDGPLGRVRPADPARLRLRRSPRGGRGGAHRRGDRLDRRHGDAPRRDPARRGLDLDDDQRACGAAAAPLRARRGGAGCRRATALRGTVQNDVLKEYVARGNYIFPPRPSMRLTTDLFAYCAERHPGLEHDLDLRLPHPRGGLDGGPGARLHARERDRLLRGGRRRRPLAGRVRRAALLLLQRAQQLLPGGREVPRRPEAVGADHARPVRRDEPAGAGAALPRADRGLDADGAAAGGQHRPRRGAGALGGLRRRAVAAHERLRRGARAADRARRDDRAAHAAGADARGGHDRHGRPARWRVLHRGADRGARAARQRADRTRRRARRRRRGDRAGLRPARDRGGGVSLAAGGRDAASGSSSASTGSPRTSGERVELHRLDPAAEQRQRERTRRASAPSANAADARRALAEVRGSPRPTRTCCPPMREALRARCTVGEICDGCASSGARTTPNGRRASVTFATRGRRAADTRDLAHDPPRLAAVVALGVVVLPVLGVALLRRAQQPRRRPRHRASRGTWRRSSATSAPAVTGWAASRRSPSAAHATSRRRRR